IRGEGMYELYVNDVYVTEGHSDYLSLALFTIIKEKTKPEDMKIELKWNDGMKEKPCTYCVGYGKRHNGYFEYPCNHCCGTGTVKNNHLSRLTK
ncbi:hypothetical protein CN630_31195, partial [Bacillus wiedmannii]